MFSPSRSTSLNPSSFNTSKISDLKLLEIFSLLIINLDLSIPKKSLFTKSIPYSFTKEKCSKVMENLKINISLSSTTSSTSYKFKAKLAANILRKFFDAKLLHCPNDRTLHLPTDQSLLQPTAKGLAIVSSFCESVSLHPIILSSPYNSMDLIILDRDPYTDNIVYSTYLVILIFQKMLGGSQNIWNSFNDPDKIPLKVSENDSEDKVKGSNSLGIGEASFSLDEAGRFSNSSPFAAVALNQSISTPTIITSSSPYHHRYFTNPDLDSHMQYYISTLGIRFQKSYSFTTNQVTSISNCLTGKSICQWLFDCTNMLHINQAIEFANLFLRLKLIEPVLLPPSKSNFDRFSNKDGFYYTLTNLGKKISNWERYNVMKPVNKQLDRFKSEIDDDQDFDGKTFTSTTSLNLYDTLKDPGLRYIFKQHLKSEFCVENLDAYMNLVYFESKISTLGNMMNLKVHDDKLLAQINDLVSDCTSIAYNIFLTYLNTESPFSLNINYQLRNEIKDILISPDVLTKSSSLSDFLNTPIKTQFVENDASSEECSLTDSSPKNPFSINSDGRLLSKLDNDNISLNEEEINVASKFAGIVASLAFAPKDDAASTKLTSLTRFATSFETLKQKLLRMMEIDSFPKFIESDLFKLVHSKISMIETSDSNFVFLPSA